MPWVLAWVSYRTLHLPMPWVSYPLLRLISSIFVALVRARILAILWHLFLVSGTFEAYSLP